MSLSFGAAGSNDRVDCGSGSSLDDVFKNGAGTVLAWLDRTGNGANQSIADKRNSYPDGQWSLALDKYIATEGNIRLIIGKSISPIDYTSNDSNVVAANTWTMVGANYDSTRAAGSLIKLFKGTLTTMAAEVSGYQTNSDGSGTIGTDAAASLYIGNLQQSAAYPFLGSIGIFALFNRVLTVGEIQDWQFNPRKMAGCVAFYRLGNNGTGTQTDLSGNLNNGTCTGTAQTANAPLPKSHRRTLYAVPSPVSGAGVGSGNSVFTSSIIGAATNSQAASGSAVFTSSIVGASSATAALSGNAVFTSSVIGASASEASASGNAVFTSAFAGDSAVGGQAAASGDAVFTSSIVGASSAEASASGNIVFASNIVADAPATTGGHFIPQYVTRKQKKRDDLREQLIDALYPVAPEIAEEVKAAEPQEIKQAVKLAPKAVQMQVAPIMAKLARLESELRRYQDQQDEEEMFDLWLMEVA